MSRKINLSMDKDRKIINTIKWEALRRNPAYIEFYRKATEKKGNPEPEYPKTPEYREKLAQFRINNVLNPDFEPGTKAETFPIAGTLSLTKYLAFRMFYPLGTFPENAESLLPSFPKEAVIFVVNPYEKKENLMEMIETSLDAVRTGLNTRGYSILHSPYEEGFWY